MAIRGHVWRDEHPLRKFVVFEIFVEHGCILDDSSSVRTVDNRVVKDSGAKCLLAHVKQVIRRR